MDGIFTGVRIGIGKGTIALLAALTPVSIASAAPMAVTLPPDYPDRAVEYRLDISMPRGEPRELALSHKRACETLGPSKCRVTRFMGEESRSGMVTMSLAPGTASAFIAQLTRAPGDFGFSVQKPDQRSTSQRAEMELQTQLLIAQKDRLAMLLQSAPADRAAMIESRLSGIASQLSRNEEQIRQMDAKPASDNLRILYQTSYARHHAPTERQMDWFASIFGLSLMVVTGVAILTALYFGILYLAFLWLRKFAVGRGLIRGKAKAAPDQP